MSGRRAGGEPGSPGARRAASSNSHIAAMQLFHELKQQFPALPDHAVSACIAQHCHDPGICHSHLSQAAAPRSTPYPTSLRNTESTSLLSDQQQFIIDNQEIPTPTTTTTTRISYKTDFNSSEDITRSFFTDFKSISENTEEIIPAKITPQAKKSFFSSGNKQTDYRRISDSSEETFPAKNSATKRFSDFTSRARSAFFGLVDTKKISETSTKSSLSSPKMDRKHTESAISQRRSPKFEDTDLTSSPRMERSSRSSLSVDKPTNFEFPAKPPIEISPGSTRKLKKSSETQTEFPQPSVSAVSDRTSPQSPSEAKDFSPFTKPPISPLTSKRPPKAAIDARISKVPDENVTNTGAVRKTPVRPATLDLPNKTSDCVEPVGVNLSVNVNVDVEQGPGQGTRTHSAVLEVTPEPTWLHQTPPSPRSFTSVNLTLRTPTTPPQGPINICSSPTSFTYTTNSWDRRQGLQSRLQITVGPAAGVGSVTAVRNRPRSCYQEEEGTREKVRAESMPDLCQVEESTNRVVLLSRQKERKEQLRNELKAGKERLHSIQKEIQALRLENTPDFRTRLKKEIKHLQAQCERLTREVDRHSESRVPLGETNAEFYRHIYTGQRHPSQRRRAPMPPSAAAEDNEPRWPCHICTFRNHPSMDKCEVCEMPRVLLGKLAAPPPTGSGSTNPPHANTPLALGMNS